MSEDLAEKCRNKTIVLKTECSDGLSGAPFCVQNYVVQNSDGEKIDEPLLNQLGMHGQGIDLMKVIIALSFSLNCKRRKFCTANCDECPALLTKARERITDASDAVDLCHHLTLG